ncbi:hypothetical protein [Chitinophaga vietnamensis]|uniref:hypothetical protein n=1 Tax=Chitinophaga vietnamensis TaxID=2593957 RepID=UPI0011789683|nr:hypothetical protein [Chitinophaga vietnamensis]
MEPYPHAWDIILERYGHGRGTYLEGDQDQPNYLFSFGLIFDGIPAQVEFGWNNTRNWNRRAANDFSIGKEINHHTILRIGLPNQQHYLKIQRKTLLTSAIFALHPHRALAGDTALDNAFIFVARPKDILPKILPELDFLLLPLFESTIFLNSDYEDAVANHFYLQIRLEQKMDQVDQIEQLLGHTHKLVSRLITI